jgi:hypothetical protein
MIAAQGGKCAVCRKADPEHVDHDHATNKVRGILCFNCNQALGNARDDVHVLQGLIRYLAASRGATHKLVAEDYQPAADRVVELRSMRHKITANPDSGVELALAAALAA